MLGDKVRFAGLGRDRLVGNGLGEAVASKLAGQAEKQVENGLIGEPRWSMARSMALSAFDAPRIC